MGLLDDAMDIRSKFGNVKKGYSVGDKKEFGIVRSTLVKYGLPIENFDKNLSNLVINEDYDKDSTEVISGTYLYRTNVLNKPKTTEDFIHELLHMSSNLFENKELLPGCEIKNNNRNFGKGLNEGITDYFTSLCVSDYKSKYPIESFFASYISKIYGMNIFKEYFNGDAIKFYSSFGLDEPFIRNFVNYLDNYHYHLSNIMGLNSSSKAKESTAENVTDSFVDCVIEFAKLLQLKKIEEKSFIKELFNFINLDSDNINFVNLMFINSSYGGVEGVFEEIIDGMEEGEPSL